MPGFKKWIIGAGICLVAIIGGIRVYQRPSYHAEVLKHPLKIEGRVHPIQREGEGDLEVKVKTPVLGSTENAQSIENVHFTAYGILSGG